MARCVNPQSAPNYGDNTMPIAVVGMACRLPGEATDPERLWKILAEQRDVWTTTPSDRFNHGLYYHPDPSRNGTVCFPQLVYVFNSFDSYYSQSNVAGGHFLRDHLGFFDAPFFNMTHAEATALDPQQRIVLECAYEAVENGLSRPSSLAVETHHCSWRPPRKTGWERHGRFHGFVLPRLWRYHGQ
jgi:acyl transferase domain-containing protein